MTPERLEPTEIQSLIAHDLRSPLAVIQSYAGLLITGQPGPLTPTQREFLAGIDAKVAEVSRLLDDLLDLGRLDAGTLDLHPEPVPVQELLDRLEQDLDAALAGAGVRVVVEVTPEDLVVRADALRLRQVLETLLVDGIAASESGQQIVVTATAADGDARLTVTDRGATFAASDREQLFTPYGGRRGTRHAAGTGLGLAVSARLVALHGGRLSVDTPAGGGTCFTVRLPAAVTTPDVR